MFNGTCNLNFSRLLLVCCIAIFCSPPMLLAMEDMFSDLDEVDVSLELGKREYKNIKVTDEELKGIFLNIPTSSIEEKRKSLIKRGSKYSMRRSKKIVFPQFSSSGFNSPRGDQINHEKDTVRADHGPSKESFPLEGGTAKSPKPIKPDIETFTRFQGKKTLSIIDEIVMTTSSDEQYQDGDAYCNPVSPPLESK